MLDLAPSAFREGKDSYDSEELEGVENIVHHDVKNSNGVSLVHIWLYKLYILLLLIDIKGIT